jgi:hypothetical protein
MAEPLRSVSIALSHSMMWFKLSIERGTTAFPSGSCDFTLQLSTDLCYNRAIRRCEPWDAWYWYVLW